MFHKMNQTLSTKFSLIFHIQKHLYFFFELINFILFLAALGLRCCARAFSSYGERGLLFVVVRRLLIAVVFFLQSTGSRRAGFSSCGSRPQLLCSMWDLPGPGLKPVSPALAGGFLPTAPPGKSKVFLFHSHIA